MPHSLADDLAQPAHLQRTIPGNGGDRSTVLRLYVRQDDQANQIVAGPEQLAAWVEDPAGSIEPLLLDDRAVVGLQAVRRRLLRELAGQRLLVAPGPGTAGEALPLEVERITLLLTLRHEAGSRDGGLTEPMVDVLTNGWAATDRELLGPDWSPNPMRPSTAALLAWLVRTAQELRQAGDSARAARVARTAEPLLAGYAPGGVLHESDVRISSTEAEARADQPAVEAQRALAAARSRTDVGTDPRRSRITGLGVALGLALWLAGTWGLDPGRMTDLGLISILRPAAFVGMGVLIATFCFELAHARPATWRLATPLVAIVGLLHGTPSVLYGTLRYSWAWKHLGILDYLHRHGSVDPSISSLGVYHNWPGFFAGTSALTDLVGLRTGVQIARWWPVAANLVVIPVLLYLYRGLWGGRDRRAAWLAVLFFTFANWIGQDYFSPQSLGFLLYLTTLGVVLHHFRIRPAAGSDARSVASDRHTARWAGGIALAMSAVIVTSHQVTPFVLVLALVALTVTRQTRSGWLAVAVTVMAVIWSFTGAWHYMGGNVMSLLSSFGQPVANADSNLVDQGKLSVDQVAVSTLGRATVLLIVAVAGLGVVNLLRRRSTDTVGLILLLAPAGLLFANSFGGEIGFRTYLFALPLLSWYAARALWLVGSGARSPHGRSAVLRAGASALVALLLFGGFCFGYYGKDRWYYFSHDEVAASDLVLTDAKPDSLLVTVTANYPGQWKDYENLVYVPIATEPADSRAHLLADPATVLEGWLQDPKYHRGYILLTRSQELEVEALGVLPHGAYASIRRSLDASPAFHAVYRTADAQVYVLAAP